MRGILEFNLPDERECFDDARLGSQYLVALSDIREGYRKLLKYTELTDQERIIVQQLQDQFCEACEDFKEKL